jgi:hypothetical protein
MKLLGGQRLFLPHAHLYCRLPHDFAGRILWNQASGKVYF